MSLLGGQNLTMTAALLAAVQDDPWLFALVILAFVALVVIIVGRWRP